MVATWTNLDWLTVLVIAMTFIVVCFLAVLWSRREWKSRRIRVGVFLEREYKDDIDAQREHALQRKQLESLEDTLEIKPKEP